MRVVEERRECKLALKELRGSFRAMGAEGSELHSLRLQSVLAPHMHCLLQEYSDDEGEEDLMPSFGAQAV